jgi:hypothetical protein
MSTTTVTATYLKPNGDPASGRVTFRLVATTYHDGLNAIFPRAPITAVLDEAGSMSTELQPTSGLDADFDADDMTYEVVELIDGVTPRRDAYYVDIPTSAGVDLGTLVTYDDPPTVTRQLVLPDLSTLGYLTATEFQAFEDAHQYLNDTVFNVTDPVYGALGGGIIDDSQAFTDTVTAAISGSRANAAATNGASEDIAQGMVAVPAGTFLITEDSALIPNIEFDRTRGIRFVGAGKYNTTIVFTPSAANKYLARNRDALMWLHFEGITFASTVSTSSFMLSDSDGGPQGTTYRDCVWIGDWKYGVSLTGSNTNSEQVFDNCDIIGDWTAFLYVDPADTSDQFVNHAFRDCNVAMSSGNLVDISKGGNVTWSGGSLIHTGSGADPQIFFAMRGITHTSGTPRLTIRDVRVENRHALSQLVYCEWATGTVKFDAVDTSSQKGQAWGTTSTTVEFDFGNWMGPTVVFDDCSLMGLHSYAFKSNSYNFAKRVTYRNCDILNFVSADLFIVNANPAPTTNIGGRVPIDFIDCRGSTVANGERYPFDCVLNSEVAAGASPKLRTVSVKISAGTLPYSSGISTAVAVLPPGATIRRVRFWKGSSGSASNTDWSYVLTDADAAEIARVQGGGVTQWKDGFDDDSGDLFIRCTTLNKRTLTLTAANITQTQAESFCLVDYLA